MLAQDFGGCRHRIRAVGNDDVSGGAALAALQNVGAVLVMHVQTVFQRQGFYRYIQRTAASGEHGGDAGLAEYQFAREGVVHFVECAAGDEELDLHGVLSE